MGVTPPATAAATRGPNIPARPRLSHVFANSVVGSKPLMRHPRRLVTASSRVTHHLLPGHECIPVMIVASQYRVLVRSQRAPVPQQRLLPGLAVRLGQYVYVSVEGGIDEVPGYIYINVITQAVRVVYVPLG